MRACAETLEPETSPAELAALTDLLKGAGLDGRHLEIGTAAGGTLRELLASYPADRRPPFVVIDPMSYFPDQLGTVRRNLAERGVDPDGVEFRVGFSQDEFPKAAARGERFQFVFIDGDHSATGVMRDMMWARLLEVGGYLCLHDVGPQPRRAVGGGAVPAQVSELREGRARRDHVGAAQAGAVGGAGDLGARSSSRPSGQDGDQVAAQPAAAPREPCGKLTAGHPTGPTRGGESLPFFISRGCASGGADERGEAWCLP